MRYKVSLGLDAFDVPIATVVEAYFEDQSGQTLLLANVCPDSGLGDGFDVYFWLQLSNHAFLPPESHMVDVLLYVVIHPIDILDSLDILEVSLD